MNRRSLNILFTILVLASLLACTLPRPGLKTSTPAPTATSPITTKATEAPTATQPPTATSGPSPTPTPSPTPMPPTSPILMYRQPDRGEELRVDAPLVLTFDQPMDKASVEKAFAIEPSVKGSFDWASDRVLIFEPAQPWQREAVYRVAVDATARSSEGLPMRQEVAFRFNTTGYLEVTEVQPAPQAAEVDLKSAITVMFNRPVVPLTSLSNMANLPEPLVIDPPLDGKGEWLNTSIYVFRPASGLAPSTDYQVTVRAGLQDTTGGILSQDYTWGFSTLLPRVEQTYPTDGATYIGPSDTISVTFNQPMDRASVESKFTLTDEKKNAVAGTFTWSDDSTRFWFKPGSAMPRNTTFVARIGQGAMGAAGSKGLQATYTWTFTTADNPRVVQITPADGAQEVDPYNSVYVRFSAPMDTATLYDNLSIEFYDPNRQERGTITPTEVYSYWYSYDTELNLGVNLRASSEFTITLDEGLKDKFGEPIERAAASRFTTGQLSPSSYFALPGRAGTFNAYTTTTVIVGYRNVSRLEFELYALTPDQYISYAGDWEAWNAFTTRDLNLLNSWSMAVSPELNKTAVMRVPVLAKDGKNPAPGTYYLQLRSPEITYSKGNTPAGYLLSISRSSVILKRSLTSAMAWLTDLKSGEPVSGAQVRLQTIGQFGKQLVTGTTDGDGIFSANLPQIDMWEDVYALFQRDDDLAICSTQWDQGIAPWDFNLNTLYYTDPTQGMLYTERPLYRPGQTVYFKGIIRLDDDAHYTVPAAGTQVEVTVEDSQGREVYAKTMQLSDMGTFDGELTLDQKADLGYYSIRARYDDSMYSTDFRVAEYKKPEFQVEVQSDRDQYIQGDTVNVTAHATYYFGGPVANAKVRWSVLSQDYFFTWDGPGWYDWREWEWTGTPYQTTYYPGYGELIAQGEGVTDADGRFTFSLPADIATKKNSQVFTLEAAVSDINNQEVASRVQAIVHKGSFYVGLAPRRYVGKVGEPSIIDVKVIDLQNQPVAGQQVDLVLLQERWYSTQKEGADGRWYWDWEVEEIPVQDLTVRTNDQGDAEASFTPQEGGSYKVRATAKDERGNQIFSATYLWVSSSEWISWRRENNDRIELIADKKAYQVGDTAEILVPSPFQGPIKALLTIERGKIIEHRVITLQGNSDVLSLPIKPEYVPNVFVSIALVKGMDESNPLSSFKIGDIVLPVSTETKQLNITLTPDRSMDAGEHYSPRDTAHYEIQVTDSTGKGVEAELSLDMVDLAVLALTGDSRGPTMLSYFYQERGVGIRTAASLILSVDRIAVELPLMTGKGGGGGEAGEGLVRTNFVDTAYWNAALRTDANGKASVDIALPDNLTTWRLRARGLTADTLVGESSVDVLSTLDVLVRTVAPRFFVRGDQATLSVIAHNNTANDLEATVSLQAAGLQIDQGPQTVTIPANDKVKVDWQVVVQPVEQVVLRASVAGKASGTAESYADALEITLPVYAYSTPEVVATAGQLEEAGERLEAIVMPQRLDPTQGELTVQVDPSLAAGMQDGLQYLEYYPYECIEQTISRWLPNVLTYKALSDLGIDDPELKAKLPGLVSEGLQRVYSEQHYDGGWGWWQFSSSNPFLTAYVLLGMVKARDADLVVDKTVMANATSYLRKQFKSPQSIKNPYEFNQQAFILYVLAEAGDGDLARSVRLADERAKMSHFAKAYLAMALGILEGSDSSRVKTLLSDLNGAAILSATGAHWEESWVDYWSMNTDTRSTAVIVDALARLDPKNALLANAVRWLMVARQAGHWETTQETAWSLIALTDYMVMTGELQADYTYTLSLNGQVLDEQTVTPQDVKKSFKVEVPIVELLNYEVNRVWVTRNEPAPGQTDQGRLYYAMYLRYFLPVEDVKALSRGILVARQYQRVNCEDEATCEAVTGAAVGDVIRAKITLVAPNDLHFLVLEDPLPAGCEAVDQSLQTTSVVLQAPELEKVDHPYGWGDSGWGWWWFTHSEVRDEKVSLFADYLPRGTYEYTYLIQASVPGEFLTMPTVAYEMYFPEVWGRGDGSTFTVTGE